MLTLYMYVHVQYNLPGDINRYDTGSCLIYLTRDNNIEAMMNKIVIKSLAIPQYKET